MIYEPNQLKDLFRKVLRGTASAEEQNTVRHYLEQEQPELHLLLPFEDWDAEEDGQSVTPEEMEAWFAKIVAAGTATPLKRRLPFRRWLPYAAALIVMVTAAFALFKSGGDTKEELIWTSVKTARGKQLQVWLPDSSRVTLNAGSTLRYPEHFEENKRQVYLSGEAFFEIRHNEASPFSVHTPLLKVSVLGTSFNVQAYPEDGHIAVAVKTGKVKVGSDRYKEISNILVPGQQVLYRKADRKMRLGSLDTSAVGQWRSHRISLDDVALEQILKVIERTYDVQFDTDNPDLLRKKYSVTFYDMQLKDVLDKLAYLGALEYSRKGNRIILKEQP